MSKYLKYTIKNTAPIRISDDDTSQHGQTDTLKFFRGSTIRGYVITQLSKNPDFESYKGELFSGKIRFLNAYPCVNGKETVPSLKGFYEDKSETEGRKKLNNVITEDVIPGYKRAALGRFCYIDDEHTDECTIVYSDVEVSDDLNINIGREDAKRNVFRSQYIRKNQTFSGYIVFNDDVDENLTDKVASTLDQNIYIGNRRSAGYGECICTQKELTDNTPYSELCTAVGGEDLYMVLLSDTVMLDENGEPTGLNLQELASKLGCDTLTIEKCATSTVDIRGYNSIWQSAIPSAIMYEAGSVFHLKASSPIASEKLRMLEKSGIGIRKDEGFGQIAFMGNYAQIGYKLAAKKSTQEQHNTLTYGKQIDIENDIKIALSGLMRNRLEKEIERYVVDKDLGLSGISDSKRGLLMSMCMELQYQPSQAGAQLIKFVDHQQEKDERKKVHDGKAKQDKLCRYVHEVLENDLFTMLGMENENKELLTPDEVIQYKLKLIIRQLRYANRGGRQ
jgi:hypothetical protein